MGLNPLKEVGNLVDKVGSNVDKLTTTKEEQEQFRSDRQTTDMASDNQLAKSIRPLSLVISWVVILSMALATILKVEIDPWIMGEFLAMHGTILSFYFYSRRGEKIAEKNAVANIKIREMEMQEQKRQNKRQDRRERKAARKSEKI
jgi:hypothetical protein